MSNEYMDLFVNEALENLTELVDGLLHLESEDPSSAVQTINELFRFAHNIKGMAATVGLDPLTLLAHKTEDLLHHYRATGAKPDSAVIDLFLAAADSIGNMIEAVSEGTELLGDSSILSALDNALSKLGQPETEEPTLQREELPGVIRLTVVLAEDCPLAGARAAIVLRSIEAVCTIVATNPSQTDIVSGRFRTFTVDITDIADTDALVAVILETTDVIEAVVDRPDETPKPATSDSTSGSKSSRATVRVEVDRLDDLMDLVGELVIGRGQLETHARRLSDSSLNETVSSVARSVSEIQAAVAKARMISLETTFQRLRRLVRDTSRDLGKAVTFDLQGGETELDRSMVDRVADPLTHLLRNALDHGIELPAERETQGKPAQGLVSIDARHEGNQVMIEVQDDGHGIDPQKVAAKAVATGILSELEASALSDASKLQLIFTPGLSTKEATSTISGRGVGMDAVRSSVADLGGSVEVESEIGAGSTFRIRMPLSVAVLEAMLVAVADETWAIPLADIELTLSVTEDMIDSVLGSPVVDLRGETLPLIHGRSALALAEPQPVPFSAIVFRARGRRYALSVDDLLEQTEIVVKPAPEILQHVTHVSGVTILGDGTVGLIADVGALAGKQNADERNGPLVDV